MLLGCASTPPRAPKSSAYLRAVEARIASASEATQFTLRHNPTSCDCPAYELRLDDVWQRAEIVGVDEDDATIQALDVAFGQTPDGEVAVEGRIEGDPAVCGLGTLYVSLVPTAFVGDAPSSD